MGALSLSRSLEEALPDTIDGCEINTDFKVILFITRLLSDDEYSLLEKIEDALYYFYVDDRPENAIDRMFEFVRAGEAPEQSDEPQQIDFEFDADEIYADFLNFYGIDLLTADLHWYRFLALFKGICAREGALSGKLQTRFMKLDGLKGKDLSDAIRAKERAQIPDKLTMEDIEQQKEFTDEWENVGI